MRGMDQQQDIRPSYLSLESRIPPSHPLSTICRMVNWTIAPLIPQFNILYIARGRKSIPSGCPLRTQLLQVLYGITS